MLRGGPCWDGAAVYMPHADLLLLTVVAANQNMSWRRTTVRGFPRLYLALFLPKSWPTRPPRPTVEETVVPNGCRVEVLGWGNCFV